MLYLLAYFIFLFFCNNFIFSQDASNKNYHTVVLDPGHGGCNIQPFSIYGDKYDVLSGKYTDSYRPGAFYNGLWENEETYKIALLVEEYLKLTLDPNKHLQFKSILKKYTTANISHITPIKVYFSREPGYASQYENIKKDPNAPYRLYDYPDIITQEYKKGTISRINNIQPELTVTIHLTRGKINRSGAMNAVITPGYKTYNLALDYAKNKNKQKLIRQNFLQSKYQNWFLTSGRTPFESFLIDACIYFTGSSCDKYGNHTPTDEFYGYRYNMFSWSYKDPINWTDTAQKHPNNSQYSKSLSQFIPQGAYWQREKSIKEHWKREDGIEGFGGDNLYAAHEILRYIRKGFLKNTNISSSQLPQLMNPYISTWAIPSYINSISAYLEIGYLDVEADYKRVLNHKKIYAESIAVGIYSLFNSLEQQNSSISDMPSGKKIDFSKYGNYFKEAKAY